MADETATLDPSETWPAGLAPDAALRQIDARLRRLEDAADDAGWTYAEPDDADPAPVAAPDADDVADYRAWVAAGRPSADRPDLGGTTSASSPAGPVSTGAGPDAPPITSGGIQGADADGDKGSTTGPKSSTKNPQR